MQKACGTTFIEILISILMLSILLLGLDGMQIYSLRQTKASYYFAVAIQQLTNMQERLQAVESEKWQEQIAYWNEENKRVLPQGRGMVLSNAIVIFWGNVANNACEKNKIGASGCAHIQIKI